MCEETRVVPALKVPAFWSHESLQIIGGGRWKWREITDKVVSSNENAMIYSMTYYSVMYSNQCRLKT